VQAAKPNPTQATPIHKVITDKPIVKVPGCPPIAEVHDRRESPTTYFGELPALDRQGRPLMFYSQRVHDKCYRRGHFDAGPVRRDLRRPRLARRLLPVQGGLPRADDLQRLLDHALERRRVLPIGSGHGCLGCSEPDFWDQRAVLRASADLPAVRRGSHGEPIGATAAAVVGVGIAGARGSHGPAPGQGEAQFTQRYRKPGRLTE